MGDKTTGGGVVTSGSAVMKFHGIGAARVGDTVSCAIPGHGPTVIAEGQYSTTTVYRLPSMAIVVPAVVCF